MADSESQPIDPDQTPAPEGQEAVAEQQQQQSEETTPPSDAEGDVPPPSDESAVIVHGEPQSEAVVEGGAGVESGDPSAPSSSEEQVLDQSVIDAVEGVDPELLPESVEADAVSADEVAQALERGELPEGQGPSSEATLEETVVEELLEQMQDALHVHAREPSKSDAIDALEDHIERTIEEAEEELGRAVADEEVDDGPVGPDNFGLDPRMSAQERKAALIDQYREALAARQKSIAQNMSYQKRLYSYFLAKNQQKLDGGEKYDGEKASGDLEQRYSKTLLQAFEFRADLQRLREDHQSTLGEASARLGERESKAAEFSEAFSSYKRETARSSENSRTGKPMGDKLIAQFESLEAHKDQEVEQIRIKYLTQRNRLKKLESSLRQKEELSEGLHLIDFEQLKIENQTLNEKIEERNEELSKLRKKTTTTVHILTHVKEKLQFLMVENQELKRELADLEMSLTSHRDQLAHLKRDRDTLKGETSSMRHRAPLVGNDDLLYDFEKRKGEIEAMKARVDELQSSHRDLTIKFKTIGSGGSSIIPTVIRS